MGKAKRAHHVSNTSFINSHDIKGILYPDKADGRTHSRSGAYISHLCQN